MTIHSQGCLLTLVEIIPSSDGLSLHINLIRLEQKRFETLPSSVKKNYQGLNSRGVNNSPPLTTT